MENFTEDKYKTIVVKNAKRNQTIYLYLKQLGYSENYLKNIRKSLGFIKVNGEDVFINYRIYNGDTLQIIKNPNTKSCIQLCIIPLDIVYEDGEILIVNKPSNLATMPTKSHYSYNLAGAITNYMQNKDENFVCRIINRLDKDTAGLVVVAKNSLAANFMANSNINKSYYTLSLGSIKKPLVIEKKILTLIGEDGRIVNKRIVSENEGKDATTYIFPLKNYKNYTLSKVNIKHGRTHQIRAHFASINHPLLGDELYGTTSEIIDHSALVCKEINLIHPSTNELMHFEIEFPEDFKRLL